MGKKYENNTYRLFDYINLITQKKNLSKYQNNKNEWEKDYNPFIINSMLATNKATLLYANILNQNWEVPKKYQLDFYVNVIPQGYLKFTKIPKASEKRISQYLKSFKKIINDLKINDSFLKDFKTDKDFQKIIDAICSYFEVSEKTAWEYLDSIISDYLTTSNKNVIEKSSINSEENTPNAIKSNANTIKTCESNSLKKEEILDLIFFIVKSLE